MLAKITSVSLLALSAIALAAPAQALEDDRILPGAKRIGHVSSGDLKGACDRSGGDYIETSEEYGCATDSGWVYCEKSTGDCVGQSGGKEETRRPRPEKAPTWPKAGALRPATPQTATDPVEPPQAEPEHAGPRRAIGKALIAR